MPIYDKPVKSLMREFADEQLRPDQIFEKSDAVAWFQKRYPKINRNTVMMHVEGMAVNAPQRKHHSNIRPGAGFDLFFKVGSGKFRLWDQNADPAPKYKEDFLAEQSVSAEKSETGPKMVRRGSGNLHSRGICAITSREIQAYWSRGCGCMKRKGSPVSSSPPAGDSSIFYASLKNVSLW